MRDITRTLAHPETGALRLAVSASLASYLAPRAVARLYERSRCCKSRIEILVPPIMVDALLDHSADLAVGLLPNEHPNLATVKSYPAAWPA